MSVCTDPKLSLSIGRHFWKVYKIKKRECSACLHCEVCIVKLKRGKSPGMMVFLQIWSLMVVTCYTIAFYSYSIACLPLPSRVFVRWCVITAVFKSGEKSDMST